MVFLGIEKLTCEELEKHIEACKYDFSINLLYSRARELSKKWSLCADSITARDEDDNLLGLVVFYANRLPLVFTTHVWVDCGMRGKGLCGQMLRCVERICAINKFTEHRLEVAIDNDAAINAYKKFGFKEIEFRDKSIIMGKVLGI